MLTVWKKSSMAFHGSDGFSVFNREGRLVYRVDNYSRHSRCFTEKIVLMDGEGIPLLHLRPQKFSLREEWLGFEGDGDQYGKTEPSLFAMRRQSSWPARNDKALVFMGTQRLAPDFHVEGSFRTRNCKIMSNGKSEVAAEVSRKKVKSTLVLADDVFNLRVWPGFNCELIMAFIIVMDRICSNAYTPTLCTHFSL